MSFIEALTNKLDQMKQKAGNLPEQINSSLCCLDRDRLSNVFWTLTEDRFRLEQRGILNADVLISNGKIEVRAISPEEMPQLENQGHFILGWTQYRKLVKELGKLMVRREAQVGGPSTGHILDLELEAEETRPQGLAPSIQLELKKIDYELQMGLRELEEDRVKSNKEWQETLKRWDEEKQFRGQRF